MDEEVDGPAANDEAPRLLRIPHRFESVADVLHVALKMGLPNVVVLSELDDGKLVLLTDEGCTISSVNWLLDRLKQLLLERPRAEDWK